METDLTADGLPDDLSELHGHIAEAVPAGVGQGHSSPQKEAAIRR